MSEGKIHYVYIQYLIVIVGHFVGEVGVLCLHHYQELGVGYKGGLRSWHALPNIWSCYVLHPLTVPQAYLPVLACIWGSGFSKIYPPRWILHVWLSKCLDVSIVVWPSKGKCFMCLISQLLVSHQMAWSSFFLGNTPNFHRFSGPFLVIFRAFPSQKATF